MRFLLAALTLTLALGANAQNTFIEEAAVTSGDFSNEIGEAFPIHITGSVADTTVITGNTIGTTDVEVFRFTCDIALAPEVILDILHVNVEGLTFDSELALVVDGEFPERGLELPAGGGSGFYSRVHLPCGPGDELIVAFGPRDLSYHTDPDRVESSGAFGFPDRDYTLSIVPRMDERHYVGTQEESFTISMAEDIGDITSIDFYSVYMQWHEVERKIIRFTVPDEAADTFSINGDCNTPAFAWLIASDGEVLEVRQGDWDQTDPRASDWCPIFEAGVLAEEGGGDYYLAFGMASAGYEDGELWSNPGLSFYNVRAGTVAWRFGHARADITALTADQRDNSFALGFQLAGDQLTQVRSTLTVDGETVLDETQLTDWTLAAPQPFEVIAEDVPSDEEAEFCVQVYGRGNWSEADPVGEPECLTFLTTSAEDGPDAEALSLSVRPNPARGAAEVAFRLARPGPAEVAVFDVLGRRVAVLAREAVPAGEHTRSVAGLAPGVYVVRLTSGGTVRTQRLTVVR